MENYVRQLDALQKIREIAGGQSLNLPQICVIGDQSSGKSSLLHQLTGVDFPVQAGTCTKAAIVVECKKEEKETCQIMDVESKEYSNCDSSDLASQILDCQSKMLATNGKNISETEINIKVGGKDLIDIIVVDLPGIINVGAGKEETRKLIAKYIKPEQTLIFLVSEAKTDAELISAVELSKEVDPDYIRTMLVLTKFDNFDTDEAKNRAVNWILKEEENELGPHAVIASPGGKEYDRIKEEEELKTLDLPQTRSGIAALKERLPTMYAKLIQTNLPGLRDKIEKKILDAEKVLTTIGKEPVDSTFLIKKCQEVMLNQMAKIKEDLSGPMVNLQNSIHDQEADVRETWTSSKFSLNVFDVPFFTGETAFKTCFSEIVAWWEPIVDKYLEDVETVLSKVTDSLESIDVPKTLKTPLVSAWKELCRQVHTNFEKETTKELQKFSKLGTVNHDLTSEYHQEMTAPQDLIDDFIRQVDDNLYKETKATLKDKLETVLKMRADNFNSGEQQKICLFSAVKAAYKVEKKTFTDEILKITRIHVLDAVRKWVKVEFVLNDDIKKGAREDAATIKKRNKSLETIEKMKACEKEINNIM